MQRYDIDLAPMRGSTFAAKCYDCGMPTLNAREFHPYEACVVYKRTHNSSEVWKVLMPLVRKRLAARAPASA